MREPDGVNPCHDDAQTRLGEEAPQPGSLQGDRKPVAAGDRSPLHASWSRRRGVWTQWLASRGLGTFVPVGDGMRVLEPAADERR
jgi:hypothetical protein